jgi:uncharacterized protein (TIGR01777 family)
MDIAITGASGLIGSALAESLEAGGDRVWRLVRRPSDDPGTVQWRPDAGTIDRDGLAGIDAMVHLAGAGIGDRRLTAARRQEVLESRTHGTALIARTLAGLDPKPRVFVSASAVGYYGSQGDSVLTEQSPAGDDFVADLVAAWEAAARPAVEAGIRTVFLRTAPVLSGRGGILPRMSLPFRLFVGGRIGSGRQWMSWVSLDDVVDIVRFVLDHDDISGPVNVVAPEPVTNADMTTALGRALHRPTAFPVPPVALRAALGSGRTDALLLASQRVHPTVLIDAGYAFHHPDLDGALAAAFGGGR